MRRRRPLEGGTLLPRFLDGNVVSRLEGLERAGRQLERMGLTGSAAAAAFGRRLVLDGWYDENVPGSSSATKMTRWAGLGTWQNDAVMTRGGTVTGLGAGVNAARTAGSLTVELYVNDVASGLQAVLDGGVTVATWETGAVSFEAGDRLSVYLSSSGWTPTSADLQVSVEWAPE